MRRCGWRGVNGRPIKRQADKAPKRKDLITMMIEAANEFVGLPIRYGTIKMSDPIIADAAITDEKIADLNASGKPLTASDIERRRKEREDLLAAWGEMEVRPWKPPPWPENKPEVAPKFSLTPGEVCFVSEEELLGLRPLPFASEMLKGITDKERKRMQEIAKKGNFEPVCDHPKINYHYGFDEWRNPKFYNIVCADCKKDITKQLDPNVLIVGRAMKIVTNRGEQFEIC